MSIECTDDILLFYVIVGGYHYANYYIIDFMIMKNEQDYLDNFLRISSKKRSNRFYCEPCLVPSSPHPLCVLC